MGQVGIGKLWLGWSRGLRDIGRDPYRRNLFPLYIPVCILYIDPKNLSSLKIAPK